MATAFQILGNVCTGLFVLVICFLGVWMNMREQRRYSKRLQTLLPEWASREGYTILFQERLPFWSTPFIPASHRGDYRVIIEDSRGQRRHGWVRFGSWRLGIYGTGAKVVWEEPESARRATSTSVTDLRNDPLWDDWLDHREHPRR
jgi:hypothetical protein